MRPGTVILILSVLLGAGCSGRSSSEGPLEHQLPASANQLSEFPVGREWRERTVWAHPTDLYRISYELWQEGIAACMASSGFTYPVAPYVDDTVSDRVVNPLNRPVAETYGYHLPATGSDQYERMIPTDEAFTAALSGGESGGGCGERAYMYAYGFPESLEYWDSLDAELARVEDQVLVFDSTDENRELLAGWSECMQSSGHSYSSPAEANAEFSGAESVSERELSVRAADLDCDMRVGLTKTRSAFEQERLNSVVDENSSAIAELESTADRLRRILADRLEVLRQNGPSVLPPPGTTG